MLAGAVEPAAEKVRAVVLAEGGGPLALVVGTRLRTSIAGAALANGTAAHALDLDDSHHPGFLHPSAVLVPAVLALGEARGASGSETVAAYLAGLEALTAIGSAINLRHYELGWHATATIGTVAAAVAGARLLRLDAERAGAALGLAASQAGGVRRNFGSMAKPLHAGLAARAGVLAALLAEQGLTAGDEVLEGERGWFDLVAGPGEWDEAAGLAALDDGFGLAVEGLGIKRFASCGVTHAPIEAALALRKATSPRSSGSTSSSTRSRGRSPPTTSRPTGCSRSSASSTASPSRCSTAAPTSTSSPTPAPATRRSWRCATARRWRPIRRSASPGT